MHRVAVKAKYMRLVQLHLNPQGSLEEHERDAALFMQCSLPIFRPGRGGGRARAGRAGGALAAPHRGRARDLDSNIGADTGLATPADRCMDRVGPYHAG